MKSQKTPRELSSGKIYVKVFWLAGIIISIVLTILINVIIRIAN